MARRTRVRIDMTPMVDVAFLLLIFFMSTTQFKPPEMVAVDLPMSQSEIHVPETGTIILTVNRTGQIFISSESGPTSRNWRPTTSSRPSSTGADAIPARVVIVKGDKDASFGVMADLMDTLARSKTLRFNLMTDLAKEPAQVRHGAPRAPQAPAPPREPQDG